jgi:hypothetical protein
LAVTPNLTVNLGLAWAIASITEAQNRQANLISQRLGTLLAAII